MKRSSFTQLLEWKVNSSRKPLLLRGARQVGKTHLVRQLGEEFSNFIELNLEKQPKLTHLFSGDLDPHQLVREISLLLNVKITPGKTLLFIDEIQENPRAITALRYFYEEMPDLHVIAAGSLVDFAINKVGVPVGRIQFMHLFPLTFLEFLLALDRESLVKAIASQEMTQPMPDLIHKMSLELFAQYVAVGGMPEAVKCWRDKQDIHACVSIHHDLIAAYRQDFHKYAKQHQLKYLQLIFDEAPRFMGRKFLFSALSGDYRKRDLTPCLDLLVWAKVIQKVVQTSAQGLPLGAGANPERFKLQMCDVALAQALLGQSPISLLTNSYSELVNRGEVIEAIVGQELLGYTHSRITPSLYYWHKESPGATAEVDYIIQNDNKILPVEVKSGSGYQMRSLKRFFDTHPNTPYGIRISPDNLSRQGDIQAIPLYAISRVIKEV